MSDSTTPRAKRWMRDLEIERESGGVFRASTLRKDRLGPQRYPFHRVGKSVYYDLAELHAIVEQACHGPRVRKTEAA